MLDDSFEVRDQPWYKEALFSKRRYMITRAGYSPSGRSDLLTISRAIISPT